ncbi:MAG: Lrp/AsnC family transcriptional regulator [Nanoarchaeota archaeon]|nr:Lrp/AsnC family transcriptional regulator [Nanoarchaeota archaeon]MBU1854655.1 Lrp/AsnC family transcriptional regulator [Nanoarchaeota archaeon]
MDKLDDDIISILTMNARTPYLQIAKNLSVSEGTIRKRISNLIKQGEIKRFTVEVDKSASAIIGIETETETETKKIVEQIIRLGVSELYEVTGGFDIIAKLPKSRVNMINKVIDEIRLIKGVSHTETFMVLK